MKSILLLAVAIMACSAAVVKIAPLQATNYQVTRNAGGNHEALSRRATRANLIAGYPVAGDVLLARQYLYRTALPNAIQSEDLVYRSTNTTTRITSVQALEVGYTQYASAWIVTGGLGYSNVTVRAQSYPGWGYYYQVDIWGR